MHRVASVVPFAGFGGPLFDVGRVLMNADRGGVDHLQIAVVSLRNRLEDPVPDAELPPPDEAVVAGRRRSVALRNVRPGRAGPQPPVDAVQHLPIIGPRHPARLVRQQRLDDRPFEIRQLVAACAHRAPPRSLNHLSPARESLL